MSDNHIKRREFMQSLLAGFSVTSLDWSAFPTGSGQVSPDKPFDAIIIGAGLAGLSCAAAFARQGFRPVVLEHHSKPGGYATTFRRKDFVFDVSLHSTVVGERNGVHNLLPGFPEITQVEFVPHTDLYRAIFAEHDIRVPQRDLGRYVRLLQGSFPEEQAGIEGLFEDMRGLSTEIGKLQSAGGGLDMSRFPQDYPYLFKSFNQTWGQMVDSRLKDSKLKAIISSLWVYFGLPPSRLSPFYYALPTLGYLQAGGWYPRGKSQAISDALASFITERGGEIRLRTSVEEILVKDHGAYGVRTGTGEELLARVVVSNANAHDTFRKMMRETDFLGGYLKKLDTYSVSLSSFQVFLGLKKDLVERSGLKDTEIFYYPSYDFDAAYDAATRGEVEQSGFALTAYDNLYRGYSPAGKNTLNLLTLQGYSPWEEYETDYSRGRKKAYLARKKAVADRLIDEAEKRVLPGLRDAIEVIEVGTPLTNVRYTRNYRGAIYGWDQTLTNTGQGRVGHKTPIKNLYLAGAWSKPGHGYGAVIPSGLSCFGEIMKEWGS
jgi:all-trans-retinol 13,14-reductase